MACVILNNPADRVPCGCTVKDRDDRKHCTKCHHGDRWHGDAWKKHCGRDDKPAAPAVDINEVTKACQDGDLSKVQSLFPKLTDKNIKDRDGDTCLLKAVAGDAADVVQYLIEQGVDASIKDANGYNAVIRATEEAAMNAARVLNEMGVNG
eukprot:NODE_1605_length_813_cov_153.621728_g1341_i0.p2 GENE.NODE_1605_length_813_cov_153.621728_g1341_i0~~NODE_1605_length_813_cov_153.621728_g1341_i0.p2  ORF type:complete len:151 (-),score=31.40 NODE_1605_length_813_cov_153.621728_g1341_i0:293-745(-)